MNNNKFFEIFLEQNTQTQVLMQEFIEPNRQNQVQMQDIMSNMNSIMSTMKDMMQMIINQNNQIFSGLKQSSD